MNLKLYFFDLEHLQQIWRKFYIATFHKNDRVKLQDLITTAAYFEAISHKCLDGNQRNFVFMWHDPIQFMIHKKKV